MVESSKRIVQDAIDVAIGERGEIGVQVAAYLDSELVIDQWAGWQTRPPINRSMETRSSRCFPTSRR